MNGRQLAEKVAELRRPLRVLFTSGYTFGALPLQGRPARACPLLTKPYRRAELARMLRRCLDRAIDQGDPIPLPYSVQAGPRAFPAGKSNEARLGYSGRGVVSRPPRIPMRRKEAIIPRTTELSCPAKAESSTLRPIGSITGVSGYWVTRLRG